MILVRWVMGLMARDGRRKIRTSRQATKYLYVCLTKKVERVGGCRMLTFKATIAESGLGVVGWWDGSGGEDEAPMDES